MTLDDLLYRTNQLVARANMVADEILAIQKERLVLRKALHEYLRQPALTAEEKSQCALIDSATQAIEGLKC